MLPRNLTLLCSVLVISFACYVIHQRTRTAMMVGEALEMIDRFYVEPVDRRTLLTSAMAGMTSTLDQHSEYIPPVSYQAFQDTIHQEFAGIGIYVDQPVENEPVRVITPLVGSPALHAGLMPGDAILEVDHEYVGDLDIRSVSERLRGPIATTVELLVQRGDEKVKLSVMRDTIQLESVIGDHRDENNDWVFRLRQQPDIVYVRMTSFGDKTVSELRNVLSRLMPKSDVSGVVLDLRGNGGGLLHAAVEVCDMFLSSGKIVSTKTRGGVVEDEVSATAGTLVPPRMPVAILIDEHSASASEIVAAALQDHGRATIVGTRSYGKGTVQNILPLEYGRSALRLTVAKYYRPSDKNIHRGIDDTEEDVWGVSPDPGMNVKVSEEDLRQLARFWEEASYPSLKNRDLADAQLKLVDPDREVEPAADEGASEPQKESSEPEQPSAENETTSENDDSEVEQPRAKSAWDLDAPLRTAVKAIQSENGAVSRATAA
ncbi:Carboxyl-terminal protease [Rhodopirellula islandica]|uniref:Carboxyl-terminal protease n=1 Tax=Rhodopirellula islandica TaxID=595434 RepID=A0A0J1EDH2_RHOIS|nr:S41 family peptidase [Rhodopirellula islandica]KLU03599.1 Carboxyl-terminal protease [Rhodopirellula islandica]